MTERRHLSFRQDPEARNVLFRWHSYLHEHDRGGRAQLRRAASPGDVVFVPAFHRLLADLEQAGFDVSRAGTRKRLAAVAGLVARVEADDSGDSSIATQLGKPRGERRAPPVSRLRFSRLVAEKSLDALYATLARVLPLVDNRVNLTSLADSILFWGDQIRRQWAYDYFRVAPERSEAA